MLRLGGESPAMTYFLAQGNIIGGICLTTVFGMGTGVTRSLSSPGVYGDRHAAGCRKPLGLGAACRVENDTWGPQGRRGLERIRSLPPSRGMERSGALGLLRASERPGSEG